MFWGRRAGGKLDDASDVEIVNKLVEGDAEAFTAFYNRYSKLIYYCIVQIERNSLEDIFQEFFVRLQNTQFRPLRLWSRSRPLPNFLRQVVRNFVLDRRRSDERFRRQDGSDILDEIEIASETASAQDTMETRGLRRGAIKAWLQLSSPRDRRIICGKFHRDTPPNIAAEREGLSAGTFRKALFDAQRRYMALVKATIPEYFP